MNRLAVRNLRSFSVQPVLNLTFRLFFLQLYTFYLYLQCGHFFSVYWNCSVYFSIWKFRRRRTAKRKVILTFLELNVATENWKNGGGTTAATEIFFFNFSPISFLKKFLFLAEFDNFEPFQTNLFSFPKNWT